MKQSDLLQASWISQDTTYSKANFPGFVFRSTMDATVDYFPDFSPPFTTTEDSSEISFESLFSSLLSDEVGEFPALESKAQTSFLPIKAIIPHPIGKVESMPSLRLEEVCKWFAESDKEDMPPDVGTGPDAERPCISQESSAISGISPEFPWNDTDRDDDQGSPCRLLKAYAEAMENGYKVLEVVIAKRKLEKTNPIGEAGERVAYHLLQPLENSGAYLREESSRNIEAAYKVFYLSFVYARLAHLTANAAILESIPDDINRLLIIEFDIGEGVQWAPVIEYISSHKRVAIKLICIKLDDECNHADRKFEETQKRLFDHARSFGLNLQVEQIDLDDLMTELKRMRKRSRSRNWFAFNCTIGLPNTGKRQSRDRAMEFLNSAEVFLAEYASRRGILTFSDTEAGQSPKTCSDFASFFDRQFMHYQALFDSMQSNFPDYLAQARMAMESLFLAPYICSASWLHQWKKMDECFDIREGNILQGRRLSQESIIEAKEMVNEANSSFKVRVEGDRENEMVLEWKGTPLVRVSSWI